MLLNSDHKTNQATIKDFGDQWTTYTDNSGYYGSLELLYDILQPFVSEGDLNGKSAASARAVWRFDHRTVGAYGTHQVSNGWMLGYDPCISDAFGGVVENAGMRRN
jgi:hypothetical protein